MIAAKPGWPAAVTPAGAAGPTFQQPSMLAMSPEEKRRMMMIQALKQGGMSPGAAPTAFSGGMSALASGMSGLAAGAQATGKKPDWSSIFGQFKLGG